MGSKGTIKLHERRGPRWGFFSDVSGIQFDESSQSSWIQIMPLGTYTHALFGKIDITHQKITDMVRNFELNVRGTELDIDYDHKSSDPKAAGWVKELQDRGVEGLWGLIQWTTPAYTALKDREYRYFSPEFADEWEHPRTGVIHKNVLFGGAITNRPFLKDILPINLHEVVSASNGGPVVDPKKLRQMLGLAEDATDEVVEAELAKRASVTPEPAPAGDPNGPGTPGTPPTPAPPAPPAPTPATPPTTPPTTQPVGETVLASESAIQMAEMREELNTLRAAHRLTETRLRFTEMQGGRKRVLSPVVLNEAQALVVKLSDSHGNELMSLLKKVMEGGLVELGEKGSTDPTVNTKDAIDAFDALITKKLSDGAGKVDYIDALEAAMVENPGAYEAYRTAQLGQGANS